MTALAAPLGLTLAPPTYALLPARSRCIFLTIRYSLAIQHRKRVRNWKKRYMVLTADGAVPSLAYYTDASQNRQKGAVEVLPHTTVTLSAQRPFAFTVSDHTMELVLQAGSEEGACAMQIFVAPATCQPRPPP